MLRRGSRLHVAFTRLLPSLCRPISGWRGEEAHTSSDTSSAGECSSSSDREESSSAQGQQVLRACLRNRRARCVGRVREQGLVPAVLIDGDKERRAKDGSIDLSLSLDAKPLVRLLKMLGKRDFISRVFDMNIYRSFQSSEIQESLRVLPRNLNYGPGKTNILNVQFMRATPGHSFKLGVPLEYLGAEHCPGLKKGGTLKKLAKYVVYKCKATELPAKIVVDMTVLEIGDRVQVQDLEVNFDLLYSDRMMPVCEIVKDVSTLKAKAKKLKNELYFKKKALAEKESHTESCSLSDDEVDVNFREDEQVLRRSQRQRDVMKESIKKSKTPVLRPCTLSDDEVDVSDDEDVEVPFRVRRQRELAAMKKQKLFERELDSLSEDESDANDDRDDGRQEGGRKEMPLKNSIIRVSGSMKKQKVSDRTLSDDEGDHRDGERQRGASKHSLLKNCAGRVSGSTKKGKASARRLCGTPFKVNKSTE